MEVLPGLALTTSSKVSSVFNAVEEVLNPGRVNSITPSRLSYLVAKLRDKGFADATIGGHLAHLKAALGYAVEWRYLPKLPSPRSSAGVRAAMGGRCDASDTHATNAAFRYQHHHEVLRRQWGTNYDRCSLESTEKRGPRAIQITF